MEKLFVLKRGNSLYVKMYGKEYDLVMPEGVKVEIGKVEKKVKKGK